MKRLAIVLALLLLALSAWIALHSSDIAIFVNGEQLKGPTKLAAEGWGILVAIVTLVCAAILLAFVVAGVGLIVLGALVLAALAASWLAFPFLLPLLVPLLIVWLFIAAFRSRDKPGR
jgi:hypothetical protein